MQFPDFTCAPIITFRAGNCRRDGRIAALGVITKKNVMPQRSSRKAGQPDAEKAKKYLFGHG